MRGSRSTSWTPRSNRGGSFSRGTTSRQIKPGETEEEMQARLKDSPQRPGITTPGKMTGPIKKPTPPGVPGGFNPRPKRAGPKPPINNRGGFDNPMIRDPGPTGNKPKPGVPIPKRKPRPISIPERGGYPLKSSVDTADERKQAILRRLKKRRATNAQQ